MRAARRTHRGVMVLVGLPVALFLAVACGAAPAPGRTAAAADSTPTAAPTAASAESADCHAERLEIMDAVEQSQARPCTSDSECATATNPGSFVKEFDIVVNAADREALTARSREHLDRCGAFYYYEPIDAIRV